MDSRCPWDTKIAGYAHPVYPSPPSSHFVDLKKIRQEHITSAKIGRTPSLSYEAVSVVTYHIGKHWNVSDVEPQAKV
jgi:hypothetical protein